MSAFDAVFTWAKIVSSSVKESTKATLYSLAGIGSDDPEDEDTDDLGETASDQEVITALGIIARPRKPAKGSDNITRYAEALGIRTLDGTLPIGARDRRLHEKFPAPKEGTIAFVGYGGAFLAFDDTTSDSGDEKATLVTLYVPYEYSNGVASKAMLLTFDPLADALSLVHSAGLALSMSADQGIVFRGGNAGTFGQIKPGLILFHADSIILKGNVSAGAKPETATPVIASSASPSVWLSTV